VPYGDVREQNGRRHEQRAHGKERREQLGIVEQRVGAGFEEKALVARTPRRVASRQGEDDEPQVGGSQPATQIRENHG
jgi:hypothetical protein